MIIKELAQIYLESNKFCKTLSNNFPLNEQEKHDYEIHSTRRNKAIKGIFQLAIIDSELKILIKSYDNINLDNQEKICQSIIDNF